MCGDKEGRDKHSLQDLACQGRTGRPCTMTMARHLPSCRTSHSASELVPACNGRLQVTSLTLGKGKQQRDRIFVAAGNAVSAHRGPLHSAGVWPTHTAIVLSKDKHHSIAAILYMQVWGSPWLRLMRLWSIGRALPGACCERLHAHAADHRSRVSVRRGRSSSSSIAKSQKQSRR